MPSIKRPAESSTSLLVFPFLLLFPSVTRFCAEQVDPVMGAVYRLDRKLRAERALRVGQVQAIKGVQP